MIASCPVAKDTWSPGVPRPCRHARSARDPLARCRGVSSNYHGFTQRWDHPRDRIADSVVVRRMMSRHEPQLPLATTPWWRPASTAEVWCEQEKRVDDTRFDAMVRVLGTESRRRGLLRAAAGGALGLVGLTALQASAAPRVGCARNRDCDGRDVCSDRNICVECTRDGHCRKNQKCKNNECKRKR